MYFTKSKPKSYFILGIIISYFPINVWPKDYENSFIYYTTNSELKRNGIYINTQLTNHQGKHRFINDNEPIWIKSHEETQSISFNTIDNYSISVDQDSISQPRNVGASENFQSSLLYK